MRFDHGDTTWSENAGWFSNDPMPVEIEAREIFFAEHGPITRHNREKWEDFKWHDATQLRNQHVGYGPDEQHKDGTEELDDSKLDFHEWDNFADEPGFDEVKQKPRQAAPESFAVPGPEVRELWWVIAGEKFSWEKKRPQAGAAISEKPASDIPRHNP